MMNRTPASVEFPSKVTEAQILWLRCSKVHAQPAIVLQAALCLGCSQPHFALAVKPPARAY